MTDVIPFRRTKQRYRDEEPTVKPTLRPVGAAPVKLDGDLVPEGEFDIASPERMVMVKFNAELSGDALSAFWIHVSKFRYFRC